MCRPSVQFKHKEDSFDLEHTTIILKDFKENIAFKIDYIILLFPLCFRTCCNCHVILPNFPVLYLILGVRTSVQTKTNGRPLTADTLLSQ